jgi:hypothetical protein
VHHIHRILGLRGEAVGCKAIASVRVNLPEDTHLSGGCQAAGLWLHAQLWFVVLRCMHI